MKAHAARARLVPCTCAHVHVLFCTCTAHASHCVSARYGLDPWQSPLSVLPPLTRYGLDPWQLAVDDALIVGYDAAANATAMPAHRDSALVTINIALSDSADYEGKARAA